MTGCEPGHLARLEELSARKADLDNRAALVKERMREIGMPVREDFASRRAFRTAVAQFRRKRG